MDIHDAANIFPLDEGSLTELAADIKAHGLQKPIELFHGRVIDGRRRLRACELAGVTPLTIDVEPADPVAYVLSLNLHRRHLTVSQVAMVGARARELYDKQAKERQKEAASVAGKASGAARRGETNVQVNSPERSSGGQSRDKVGEAVGVGGSIIDQATKVLKQAEPEVVKAVDEGRMTVNHAAKIIDQPPEVQRQEASAERPAKQSKSVKTKQTQIEEASPQSAGPGAPATMSVGIVRANEAINCLIRIPKDDRNRKRGFQIVTDWIRCNP